ncbi:hypothetical protein DFH06DRAFT_1132200 [Mycena polygramma]|nr:hypothetical protein DFH06DRAFT_1132200 [Mycena polygramma]
MQACLNEDDVKETVKDSIRGVIRIAEGQKNDLHLKIDQLREKRKPKGNKPAKNEESDREDVDGSDHELPVKSDKPTSDPHAIEILWWDMDDEAKDKMAEDALSAVKGFVNHDKKIPSGLKRLLKLVPGVVPECSYISKKLALHIFLVRGEKSNPCVFHSLKSSGRLLQQDGNGKKYVVHGIPHERGTIERNAELNTLSCGCNIDEALMDFIFYKVWTAKSHHAELEKVETLHGEPMQTRFRTFITQALTATGIKLEDLYVGGMGEDFGTASHFVKLVNCAGVKHGIQLQLGAK